MLAISNIKILCAGGAGLGVANDILAEMPNANVAAIDTDGSALERCRAERKLLLAENGEGAGGDIQFAKQAAAKHADELSALASGTRLLVIIAGLGGGTGSIIAPMISKIAASNPECKTVSFSILPLSAEGAEKAALAKKAKEYLDGKCLAAFALPNDIILARENMPISQAYGRANSHISNAVRALVKMLSSEGMVNIDYPSFVKIFSRPDTQERLQSFAAFGRGYGENAVSDAVDDLLKSPLLPDGFAARSMLLGVRCPPNFEMNKMQMLLETASQKFGTPARLAFGVVAEENFDSAIELCALGMCEVKKEAEAKPASAEPIEEPLSEPTSEPAAKAPAEQKSVVAKNEQPLAEKAAAPEAAPLPENPPAPAIDVSKPPVPVEPEKRGKSLFGFGRKKKAPAPKIDDKQQTEFKFMELSQQRGFFLDTPPNIRNGEDLDVPAFMRRGIKINLQ